MEAEPRGTFLGMGSTRIVYGYSHKYVIKVPRLRWDNGHLGERCNYHESAEFRRYGRQPCINGIVRAWCKSLANGWLLMERLVETRLPQHERPPWADYVDCGQVGIARDGIIVAFDYGL
jgi:hypothetical protein